MKTKVGDEAVLGPQLNSSLLAGAAVRLLREHWRRVVLIWVASAGIAIAINVGANHLGPDWSVPNRSPSYLAVQLLFGLNFAFAATVYLQALTGWLGNVAGDAKVRTANLLKYVGLVTLGGLALTTASLVTDSGRADAQSAGHFFLMAIVGLALSVVILFVTIRLVLWPAGMLLGRPDITPRGSWRLMRGASGGLFGANVPMFFLIVIPLVIAEFAWHIRTKPAGFAALSGATGSALNLYSVAVVAAVYRARVLGFSAEGLPHPPAAH
jgi:hypothetical protein